MKPLDNSGISSSQTSPWSNNKTTSISIAFDHSLSTFTSHHLVWFSNSLGGQNFADRDTMTQGDKGTGIEFQRGGQRKTQTGLSGSAEEGNFQSAPAHIQSWNESNYHDLPIPMLSPLCQRHHEAHSQACPESIQMAPSSWSEHAHLSSTTRAQKGPKGSNPVCCSFGHSQSLVLPDTQDFLAQHSKASRCRQSSHTDEKGLLTSDQFLQAPNTGKLDSHCLKSHSQTSRHGITARPLSTWVTQAKLLSLCLFSSSEKWGW